MTFEWVLVKLVESAVYFLWIWFWFWVFSDVSFSVALFLVDDSVTLFSWILLSSAEYLLGVYICFPPFFSLPLSPSWLLILLLSYKVVI